MKLASIDLSLTRQPMAPLLNLKTNAMLSDDIASSLVNSMLDGTMA